MFSNNHKPSHKLRLAFTASVASGLVLAIVFIGVILYLRQSELNTEMAELRAAMASIKDDPFEKLDVQEFHEAHPDLTVSQFDRAGAMVQKSGRNPGYPIEGPSQKNGLLSVGVRTGDRLTVVTGDWRPAEEGLKRTTLVLVALLLPLSLGVGAAVWWSARSTFQPLESMSRQAAEISAQSLSNRISSKDQAEFAEFASYLNAMLDRIQAAYEREEQFVEDAAHELRTPLSVLRLRIETALLKDRAPTSYRDSLRAMLTEIDRLSALTESLLLTARGHSLTAEDIELRPRIEQALDRWRSKCEEKKVDLEFQWVEASCQARPEEIDIVLDNLLSNAYRFAPSGTSVWVSLSAADGQATVCVEDSGPGIPQAMAGVIMDRFTRGDNSRNRASGGAGLGLALCKKLVEARGGNLRLVPTDQGARFQVAFPLSAAAV